MTNKDRFWFLYLYWLSEALIRIIYLFLYLTKMHLMRGRRGAVLNLESSGRASVVSCPTSGSLRFKRQIGLLIRAVRLAWLRGCSVAAPDWIWRLQNRVDLEPQSDLEVPVRLIWRLSDLELLQIGSRVKFARFTVYSSWTWALGVRSIWSFFLQINRQVESGALLVHPSDCPPHLHCHHPYRRLYYCCSCRLYTMSSS